MRVLLVNTSDNTGGAAVACTRLMYALRNNGVEATMLVRDKKTQNPLVTKVRGKWWKRLLDTISPEKSFSKTIERIMLLPYVGFSWKKAWGIDSNLMGTSITHMKEFIEADVIHLHWVNQGMLSMHDIRKIMKSGKRIVWTMHDIWPATALCHYALECKEFTSEKGCRNCPLVGRNSELPKKTWKEKTKTYARSNGQLTFVTCSQWLGNQARSSRLLSGYDVVAIPNPIDTSVFSRNDKAAARKIVGLPEDKKVILFVSQKVTDERKGARYFIESLKVLSTQGMLSPDNAVVAILGGHSEDIVREISSSDGGEWNGVSLGYVTEESYIVNIYNSADCYVLPSLADNLPNTIMEAMACGVPCVGFDIGGIPEMIDHEKNGYIAVPRDANDLARGIGYCIGEHHDWLSDACLEKVSQTYSQAAVAERFKEVY